MEMTNDTTVEITIQIIIIIITRVISLTFILLLMALPFGRRPPVSRPWSAEPRSYARLSSCIVRTRVRTASSRNTRLLHGACIVLFMCRRKHVAHARRLRVRGHSAHKTYCRHVGHRGICLDPLTSGTSATGKSKQISKGPRAETTTHPNIRMIMGLKILDGRYFDSRYKRLLFR